MRISLFLLFSVLSTLLCAADNTKAGSRTADTVKKRPIAMNRSEISEHRKLAIVSIIEQKVDSLYNVHSKKRQAEIFKEMSDTGLVLEPETPADTRSLEEVTAAAKVILKKRYPQTPAAVEKETLENLSRTLPPILAGQECEIRYTKGGRTYSKKGKYGGITDNNTKIKVGFDVIPLQDIIEEDQIRLVPEKLKKHIAEIAAAQKLSLRTEMLNFHSKNMSEMRDAIEKRNERLGYIWDQGEWKTPKAYALYVIELQPVIEEKIIIAKPREVTDTDRRLEARNIALEDAARAVRAWGMLRYTGLDAFHGIEDLTWLMPFTEADKIAAEYPGYEQKGPAIAFQSKMPKLGVPADSTVTVQFHSGYLFAVKFELQARTREDARGLFGTFCAQYGSPIGQALDFADSEITIEWLGVKKQVRASMTYLPSADSGLKSLSLTLSRNNAMTLIEDRLKRKE